MAVPCKTCASWQIHQCGGCEYFTGVYPQKKLRPLKKVPNRTKKHRSTGIRYTKYGLSPIQQDQLKSKIQDNQCAFPNCSKTFPLVLDHDHKTNKARGYLCHSHNRKMSAFDNKEFMVQAQEYVKNPPAEQFYT